MALLDLAEESNIETTPKTRAEWAALAAELGVKVIHIAERDTQIARIAKQPGEFVNTWSIDGFVAEGMQPAELGWGTHERHFPADGGRHDFGTGCAIFLNRPGAATRVRSWTPLEGPYHGFLITHAEAISIADYYTHREGETVRYRPTVHYAYHPCDDAVLSIHELWGKNFRLQELKRLMMDEIEHGIDELGVLLMGHAKGAYWYGSRLSVEEARRLVRFNNATSLQVTAAALAGMIWALENPAARPGRARRNRPRADSRNLPALSRQGGRRIQRLESAVRSRAAFPRGSRQRRSLAVQEFPGRLVPDHFDRHPRASGDPG